MSSTEITAASIKVFISYSWTSEEHKVWVRNLADRLRDDGFDVILDQTHLAYGQNTNKFMEQTVADDSLKKVIIIVDLKYTEKANESKGGVGTESQIISPAIYENVLQTKFIPVLRERDADGKQHLPAFLGGRMFIDMSDEQLVEDNYEELTRALADKPLHKPKPIGKTPSYLLEKEESRFQSSSKLRAAENGVRGDKSTARGSVQDALEALRFDLETLVIKQDVKWGEELDKNLLSSLKVWAPLREDYLEMVKSSLRYGEGKHLNDLLPEFFESCLEIARPDSAGNREQGYASNVQYAVYELFLYSVSLMIGARIFQPLSSLLNASYRYVSYPKTRMETFAIFRPLDEMYLASAKKRADDKRWTSPIGQLLKESAANERIFSALCQADCLLMLRSKLDEGNLGPNQMLIYDWRTLTYPYFTDPYGDSINDPSVVEFLERAKSKSYFERIKPVLNVQSADDLKQLWSRIYNPEQNRRMGSHRLSLFGSMDLAIGQIATTG